MLVTKKRIITYWTDSVLITLDLKCVSEKASFEELCESNPLPYPSAAQSGRGKGCIGTHMSAAVITIIKTSIYNSGSLTVSRIGLFLQCAVATLSKVKNLSTSSVTANFYHVAVIWS